MFKKSLLCLTLGLLALTTQSNAGTIKVVNEIRKPFQIIIEPTGDKNASFIQEISSDSESSFEITFPQLNGKIGFSITGDLATFKSTDKCLNLNVEKDYKVTFRDDLSKITCIAEEIFKKS